MSVENLDVNKIREELATDLSTGLYQIFTKNLKHSVSIHDLEKMQHNCRTLAKNVLKGAELKSVELSVRLAKSTDEAFSKIQSRMERQQAKIDEFSEVLDKFVTKFDAFQAQLSDIRSDIKWIEDHSIDSGK